MNLLRKVLLTGSSGHLGSKTLELLKDQYEVHALVRNKPSTTHANVAYHEIDLSRDWSTSELPQEMDAVIHLAQSRNYRKFPEQSLETFRVNTGTTALLLDYARQVGVRRFILASTGGLYQPSASVINEHTPVNPPKGELHYYFSSKLSAELLAESYSTLFDVDVIRPFFIYGPGQSAEKLIARLIASVREGRPIGLKGDGTLINPVHVDDAADALRKLLDANGSRTLNVAGPDVVSIRQIAECIGLLLDVAPIFDQTDGGGDMIVADHQALAALLGRELISFSSGMKALMK